jgi:uncharacterized membrane protein YphA (DoxX/SURF4 family)
MSESAPIQKTLVALILRLSLAAIFIYHGVGKISGPGNEWGAAWARNLWRQQSTPPDEVLTKLDQLPGETPERIKEIEEKLKTVYSRGELVVPEVLQITAAQFAVAWGELLAGVALLFGILTRLAALGMVIIQAGAVYTVTGARGFAFGAGGGYEYNLALLAMCVGVVILGGGALSMDRLSAKKRKVPESAHAMVGR